MTQDDYVVMKKTSREKLIKELKEVKKENQQLKNNRDKAIEYLKEKADYPISYYHCIRETIDILKGDSDENRNV